MANLGIAWGIKSVSRNENEHENEGIARNTDSERNIAVTGLEEAIIRLKSEELNFGVQPEINSR